MGFDLEELHSAVNEHGRVTRVVIADIRGSSPREIGAAMLVWKDGQAGTIGGGTLEFEAAIAARAQRSARRLSRHALGPELGQCCGGAVTLLSEIYDAERMPDLFEEVVARPVGAGEMPLSVTRLLSRTRAQGLAPDAQLLEGWMIEPVHRPSRQLWIWGAGHVGRALVDVLAPIPDLSITWVDTSQERFPSRIPVGVTAVPTASPATLVAHAPVDGEHLVLTYSHALDLEVCNRLLHHSFRFAGLIGSATKWARFRSRLKALGHVPDQIARITCPIGTPTLGKHPQIIAIGVAGQLLQPATTTARTRNLRA